MITTDDTLQPGDTIADYRIDKVLGSGSFGVTYLGFDLQLNRGVAIKEYMPVHYAKRDQTGTIRSRNAETAPTFAWGLDRFSEEARTLAQFNHPNIVRVLRIIQDMNGTSYIVMELLGGTNFEVLIEKDGPLSVDQFLQTFRQILDGVEAIHKIGILHRDIKPANIVSENRGPVLIDFGAARDLAMQAKAGFSALVTDGFSPPEQYSSKNSQSEAADIYALAATGYYMLTGQIPPSSAARMAGDEMASFAEICPQLPTQIAAALDRGMELKPADRPASIEAWRASMPLLDATDKPEPETVFIERGGFAINRRAVLLAGGGLLVAGGAAAVLLTRDASISASATPLTRSWTKTIAPVSSEPYPGIAVTENAVYVAGHRADADGDRLLVSKFSDDGSALGEYAHDIPGSRGHALLVGPDGGVIVGGETPNGSLIVSLDSTLKPRWVKQFEPGSISSLLSDENGVIAGLEGPDSSGTAKLLFVDAQGQLASDLTLLDRRGDSVQKVARLPDGALAVLGMRLDQRTLKGVSQSVASLWVAKIALTGEEIWRVSENGLGFANGLDLIAAGGDVYVTGRTSPDGALESYRLLVVRIGADGQKIWSRSDYEGAPGSGRSLAIVGESSPRLYLAGRAGDPPRARLSQLGPDGAMIWDGIDAASAGFGGAAASLAMRPDGTGFVVNVDAPTADALSLVVSRLSI